MQINNNFIMIQWVPPNWFCNRHMFPAKIVIFCFIFFLCVKGGREVRHVGFTGLRNILFCGQWILCRDIFTGVTRSFIRPMFSPWPCRNNIHKSYASDYLLCFFCYYVYISIFGITSGLCC